jgi:ERCC4-related helicase
MRIQAELDRCATDKKVWFMAPTLELCTQQYKVLQEHLPAVHIKFLSGNDNVDKWTDLALWNSVLKGVSVVVCTHQILLDALTHGFVRFSSLALLVFDEAHICVRNNAGAQIMRLFYTPAVALEQHVPVILGLSASPIMNSKLNSLEKIEETMHSVCTHTSLVFSVDNNKYFSSNHSH